jgi:hypothetical protein
VSCLLNEAIISLSTGQQQQLLKACNMPETILSPLHALSPLIFIMALSRSSTIITVLGMRKLKVRYVTQGHIASQWWKRPKLILIPVSCLIFLCAFFPFHQQPQHDGLRLDGEWGVGCHPCLFFWPPRSQHPGQLFLHQKGNELEGQSEEDISHVICPL